MASNHQPNELLARLPPRAPGFQLTSKRPTECQPSGIISWQVHQNRSERITGLHIAESDALQAEAPVHKRGGTGTVQRNLSASTLHASVTQPNAPLTPYAVA